MATITVWDHTTTSSERWWAGLDCGLIRSAWWPVVAAVTHTAIGGVASRFVVAIVVTAIVAALLVALRAQASDTASQVAEKWAELCSIDRLADL